ncbi:MAG: hypothetical protein NVS2B9_01350 [Myxococcales bacterium]
MTIDRRFARLPFLASLILAACATTAPGGRQNGPGEAAPPAAAPLSTRERIEKGGPAPATFFPLAVGNEWTYAVSAGGQTQQETIHIVGRDGAWFLDDQRGRLRIEQDGVRDRDRYLLRAPIVPGASWTSVDNLVVQKFALAGTDVTFATPAGRFEHCVVVRNDQPLPGGARFVTEWTYAPHIGLVALRTFTSTQGKEKTQTSLTLVAYRLEPNPQM